MLVMENINMTHEFKHPKYYKELRDAGNELAKRNAVKEDLTCSGSSPARNKLDQAISKEPATAGNQRSPGPGPKASSYKLPGPRPISNANKGLIHKQQAPGYFFPDKVLQRQESGSLLR